MTDFYRRRLAHALWTWREGRHSTFHKQPRAKDRPSGRAEKRRARQAERRDIEAQR